MAKPNRNVISDLSETPESNISFLFSTPSSSNVQNPNIEPKCYEDKKIFEIFHKKEIILNIIDIKNSNSKKKESILYKCIYCYNKYNNIYRLEAHMKIHVSYIK